MSGEQIRLWRKAEVACCFEVTHRLPVHLTSTFLNDVLVQAAFQAIYVGRFLGPSLLDPSLIMKLQDSTLRNKV